MSEKIIVLIMCTYLMLYNVNSRKFFLARQPMLLIGNNFMHVPLTRQAWCKLKFYLQVLALMVLCKYKGELKKS